MFTTRPKLIALSAALAFASPVAGAQAAASQPQQHARVTHVAQDKTSHTRQTTHRHMRCASRSWA